MLVPALGFGPVLSADPHVETKIRPKSFSGILIFGSWFQGPVLINTGRGPITGTKNAVRKLS